MSVSVLSASSAVQKILIDVPLRLNGFVAPVSVGTLLGGLLGIWVYRDRRNRRILAQRAEQTRLLNAELSRRGRELEEALEKQHVLLGEVHHRVRNNLQVLMSLIALHQERCDGTAPRTESPTTAISRRIQALATVYDDIGRELELADIPLQRLLSEVSAGAIYGDGEGDPIRCEIEGPEVNLDIRQAVPLGLLVSELVALSRYAGPGGSDGGRVHLRVARRGETLVLTYEDSREIPEKREQESPCGPRLTQTLMETLVDQLEGSFRRLGGERGLSYEITFADTALRHLNSIRQ